MAIKTQRGGEKIKTILLMQNAAAEEGDEELIADRENNCSLSARESNSIFSH